MQVTVDFEKIFDWVTGHFRLLLALGLLLVALWCDWGMYKIAIAEESAAGKVVWLLVNTVVFSFLSAFAFIWWSDRNKPVRKSIY